MQDEVKTLEQWVENSTEQSQENIKEAKREGARAVLEFARSKARWGFTPDGDMVRIADLEAFVKGEQ